jgi:TRAP-type mannitol/chloroaromatic compound transport system substrate-binding protein
MAHVLEAKECGMDRRDFLLATGGVAIGAAAPFEARASAIPAVALPVGMGAGRRLSFDMSAAQPASWGEDQARRLAAQLGELSGGDLMLGSHQVTGPGQDAGAVQADITWLGEDALVALHPAFAYATGLPGQFALTAHDAWAWQQVGGAQDLVDALAAPYGFKVLLAGHRGASPLFWTNQPVESLAHLSGAKVHSSGLSARVLAGLGAVPARVAEDDLGAAMAVRVIAGAELGGSLDGGSAHAAGVAKFFSSSLAAPQGSAWALVIALSVWEQLSGRERALLRGAAASQHRLALAEDRAYGPMMLAALTARFGVQHTVLSKEFLIAAEAVSRAVVAEIAACDEPSRRLNASYMAFRAAVAGADGSMAV